MSKILNCICIKITECDVGNGATLDERLLASRYNDQIIMMENHYAQPLERIYKYEIKPTFKSDYEFMCNAITSAEFNCNDGSPSATSVIGHDNRVKIGRIFSILMLLKHMANRCRASSRVDELEFIVKFTVDYIEKHYMHVINEEGGWNNVLQQYTTYDNFTWWLLTLTSAVYQCIGYLRNSGI